jgi:hypothetical protein
LLVEVVVLVVEFFEVGSSPPQARMSASLNAFLSCVA